MCRAHCYYHRQTPTASFILPINQPSAPLHYLLLLSQQISPMYHYISYTSTKITSAGPESSGCVKGEPVPSVQLSVWMMLCIRASITPVTCSLFNCLLFCLLLLSKISYVWCLCLRCDASLQVPEATKCRYFVIMRRTEGLTPRPAVGGPQPELPESGLCLVAMGRCHLPPCGTRHTDTERRPVPSLD